MSGNNDDIKMDDTYGGSLVMGASMGDSVQTKGVFHAELIRDGKVIWTDTFPNVVTTQGKNAIADKFLDLGAAYAAIAMGLHTTVGNASSTYASPSPQVESVVYSNATRPVPSFSAASAGVKSTSSNVSFAINGSATITGAFIAIGAAGVTTKSDTAASAVLFSTGTFTAGSRAVINGDTLNVSYSLTLT
jgi:hypothetical protein